MTSDPSYVVMAGDWHGNTKWACQVIQALPELLPDEESPLILQLGDFGIWAGREGASYLRSLTAALHEVNARLWFVHGNHENHDILRAWSRQRLGDDDGRISVTERISWLRTNTRWRWHGRTWVAVGGAVSVDRALRRGEGIDWWSGEILTEDQADAVIASGPADVIVSHDCPSSVSLSLPPVPTNYGWAVADLARSQAHRERLQHVVDGVQPELLMHGHYHAIPTGRSPSMVVEMAHGPVRVHWFGRDGDPRNFGVLDVRNAR